MKFRAFLFFVLFLVLAEAFAQQSSIQFWASLPEPDNTQMQALVRQYNANHADAPVAYRNFASEEELAQALHAASRPDIALVDHRLIKNLKSALVPAEDILSGVSEMVRTMAEADTFKPIWQSCVYDGKAYGIPFSAENLALVLNPRYFAKQPKIATIREWEKAAAAFEKPRIMAWGMVLPTAWDKADLGDLWINFVTTLAASNDKIPAQEETRPFNLHDETAALNLWWNWTNRSKIATLKPFSPVENFVAGASWIMRPRDVDRLPESFWVEPLPKAKNRWGSVHVKALVFFNGSRGWDLANFLTDYPQLKFWALNTPTIPVNKQVYLSPDYLQFVDSHRPWLRTYIESVSQQNAPRLLLSPEELQTIGDTILKSLRNEITVQEAALRIHNMLFNG